MDILLQWNSTPFTAGDAIPLSIQIKGAGLVIRAFLSRFEIPRPRPSSNPLEVEVGLYNGDEEVYKALMEVKPFGQARANETQYCFAEWPCDEVTKAKVLNVWEIVDGKRVQLPREIIVPDNYQPVEVVR